MNTKMRNVAEKANEVKVAAKEAAKYVGVAVAGAGIGAGVMWMVTHGHADKIAAAVAPVVDAATDVAPEVVEATIS